MDKQNVYISLQNILYYIIKEYNNIKPQKTMEY